MKNKKICIINYGMGNIHSVYNALVEIGFTPIVTDKKEAMKKADCFILPGVGAFEEAMKNLNNLNLIDEIKNQILGKKKYILGICLGMQLFADNSEEGKLVKGLSLIPGKVLDFKNKIKSRIPHIGWNSITIKNNNQLFSNINNNQDFYFVHRYFYKCKDEYVSSITNYEINFISSINHKNIFGVQFHPERSHNKGIKLLKNFATL